MKQIINCETGEVTERNFNKAELEQAKIDALEVETMKAESEAKAVTKAALLERLGITAEEAALLLG